MIKGNKEWPTDCFSAQDLNTAESYLTGLYLFSVDFYSISLFEKELVFIKISRWRVKVRVRVRPAQLTGGLGGPLQTPQPVTQPLSCRTHPLAQITASASPPCSERPQALGSAALGHFAHCFKDTRYYGGKEQKNTLSHFAGSAPRW